MGPGGMGPRGVAMLLASCAAQQPATAASQNAPPLDRLTVALGQLEYGAGGTVSAASSHGFLPICSVGQGNASYGPCSPLIKKTQWCTGDTGAGGRPGTFIPMRPYLFDQSGAEPVSPPLGMRSSNALGGFGTGFFNLRADGEIRNWQLDNSATSATSITPARPEMLLAVRVGGKAHTLRTHPPTLAGEISPLPGVSQLSYHAAHPVTRLDVQDPSLPLTVSLSAFSPFKLWSAEGSAVPAVAFALSLHNPTAAPMEASFMVSAPMFIEKGLSRLCTPQENCAEECVIANSTHQTTAADAVACKQQCSADIGCESWSLNGTSCTLSRAIERTVAQQDGLFTGTRGQWMEQPGGISGGATLVGRRPARCQLHSHDPDQPCLPNYDSGDLAFTVANSDSDSVRGTTATSDDMSSIWKQFVATGSVGTTNNLSDKREWSTGMPDGYGAISATQSVAAGANITLTIVMAWNYPNAILGRCFYGYPKNVGNHYSSLYPDAASTAAATAARLPEIVADISAWNRLWFGTALPEIWQDFFVNSFSAWKVSGRWYGNGNGTATGDNNGTLQRNGSCIDACPGKNASECGIYIGPGCTCTGDAVALGSGGCWQFYENPDDMGDINPLHVIGYHSLLRASFFPELSVNMLANLYVPAMDSAGHEPEWPGGVGSFMNGGYRFRGYPFERNGGGGGREMSGSNTLLIIDIFQTYRQTGDQRFFDAMYPKVELAVGWLIDRAARLGVPEHLQSTYDSWELDTQDITSYSAHLYIAALRLTRRLASIRVAAGGMAAQNATALAARCAAAEANATQAIQRKLWYPTNKSDESGGGYYRAFWNEKNETQSSALMSDSMYGAVWSFLLGEGNTTDASLMRQHMVSERRLNRGPYGLLSGYQMRSSWKNKGFDPPDHNQTGHSGVGMTADGYCAMQGGGAMPEPPELGRVPGNDCSMFPAMSFSHAALSVWLGENAELAMGPATDLLHNVRSRLKDWYDWNDLYLGPFQNCSWCDQFGGPETIGGYPGGNTNYARQQIGHALVPALSGQQWDAPTRRLSFSFARNAPMVLPFHTAFAIGHVSQRAALGNSSEASELHLEVLAGRLDVHKLVVDGHTVAGELVLEQGDHRSFALSSGVDDTARAFVETRSKSDGGGL